jgi:hypothetical protein
VPQPPAERNANNGVNYHNLPGFPTNLFRRRQRRFAVGVRSRQLMGMLIFMLSYRFPPESVLGQYAPVM